MASSPTSLSASSSSSSSSSSAHQWKYDVFLSFRGEDTRKSFTGHLHRELCRKGIYTFIDDQLRRGEQISPALLKAIEKSRFSIIIFSKNYASSSWCLDELTKILDCVEAMGHTAIPVFYNVDPSHVRKQTESFAEAFAKHEQICGDKSEKVLRWRKALTVASGLSGYDSRDRDETKVIDEVVSMIFKKLIDASPSNMEDLVGISSRIQDVVQLLDIGSVDVRMVGIWGMAGIGKTTLAYQVYDRIKAQFDHGHCCLLNVREDSHKRGLPSLQAELLSQIFEDEHLKEGNFNRRTNFIKKLHSRKVLILLDDVDTYEQLEILAGNHNWFGAGSRIIITTKDKALLDRHNINAIYEVEGLNSSEAYQLFHRYAFQQNPLTENYMELCWKFVDYAKGLPLAIKVLGSFVKTSTRDELRSALDELKGIPHDDIMKVLRISFDGLADTQKDIFLDIAFFFKGQDKNFVEVILEACDFSPAINIKVLENKSLIIVSNNKLYMHDLLQEMGWEIVKQEKVTCPGKRSRLWSHDDVIHVLISNTGTVAVEGIALDLSASKELSFSTDAFTKMEALRLLRFYNAEMDGSLEYLSRKEFIGPTYDAKSWTANEMQTDCKLHLSGDFKFLSNNLRSLYWHGYPSKCLPSNFNPSKLVELNMCSSRLEKLWEGKKTFGKLKFIKLSHSRYLTRTPDFSGAQNLERIILEGCTSLVKVHPSIGALKKLIFLDLEGCKKLVSLPQSLWKLTSLQILTLAGCSALKKLPDELGGLQGLVELNVDGSGIQEVPPSITLLTNLQVLSLAGCKKGNVVFSLWSSPTGCLQRGSLLNLSSLKMLTLRDCNLSEGALPSDVSPLSLLERLDLSENNFITIPSLSRLSHLTELSLMHCKSLQSVRELPSSIRYVYADDCPSMETFSYPLIASQSNNLGAITFTFCGCYRLVENEHSDTVEAIVEGIQHAASIPKFVTQDGVALSRIGFHTLIPGNSIPEWFIHQNMGSSVTVVLPSHWHNLRLMGLAVCAVLKANPACNSGTIGYVIRGREEIYRKAFSWKGNLGKGDVMWFRYQSDIQSRNSPNAKFWQLSGCLVISFQYSCRLFSSRSCDGVVKKCGVRLVMEQGV